MHSTLRQRNCSSRSGASLFWGPAPACQRLSDVCAVFVRAIVSWAPHLQAAESSDSSDSDDSTAPLSAAKRQRLHRDGTASTATEEEAAIAAALAKDRWGRFGGRDGKMARIRAQELLASASAAAGAAGTPAANGARSPPAAAAAAAAAGAAAWATAAPAAEPSAVGSAGSPAAQRLPGSNMRPATSAKQRKQAAGKETKRAAAEEVQAAAAPEHVMQSAGQQPKPRKRRKDTQLAAGIATSRDAAPDSDRSTSEQGTAKPWWGASRFVSSGCLTGLQQDDTAPATKQRAEFSESTQVRSRVDIHK